MPVNSAIVIVFHIEFMAGLLKSFSKALSNMDIYIYMYIYIYIYIYTKYICIIIFHINRISDYPHRQGR
jgi:hypothetical protein